MKVTKVKPQIKISFESQNEEEFLRKVFWNSSTVYAALIKNGSLKKCDREVFLAIMEKVMLQFC